MEQRICIKFCVRNGIKCCTTLEMLNVAFGECSMNKSSVYKWYKRFQEGREDTEDDERPGRPSTSTTDDNVETMKKMIMDNRRITIREVVRSIRSITWKFYAVCVKQSEENARTCGETIHGNCTTITHQLTPHCLFVIF